ncbi:MAG TPA: ParA family protein [Acidimicrobiales bacterium]|nr:ParA family protein [Acidimicrobiales bacterium]
MIVVCAALKGGVGKTTTAVYLAALAAASDRRGVTLVDADAQASAAEWVENAPDERLQRLGVAEAPTARLLTKALEKVAADDVAIVDTPPGNERLLGTALERSSAVVIPTRVGGIEPARASAVLEMVPDGVPAGLVVCSARTFTRDYQDTVTDWGEEGVRVWGTVPERVAIAAGPDRWLAFDGIEAYRGVWRRVQRAAARP